MGNGKRYVPPYLVRRFSGVNIAIPRSIWLVLIAVGLFIPASTATACDCAPPESVEEAAAEADAVFAGTVQVIRDPGLMDTSDLLRVHLFVDTVWKGDVAEYVWVRTEEHRATCGYEFEQGERYIVYASEYGSDWRTSICQRTQLASDADEDVDVLGEGEQPEGNRLLNVSPFFYVWMALLIFGGIYVLILFKRNNDARKQRK